jgi:radical SAM-linked protein
VRVRIRFSKLGKVRFLGHRDVARVWERSWRRCGLAIEYTQGFSPRPRVHFGLALPTGYESLAEYLDVDVPEGAGPLDLVALPELLSEALPEGMAAQAASAIERSEPSLQEAVTSSTWLIEAVGRPAAVTAAVDQALEAETIVVARTRKGKPVTDDIRPFIRELRVEAPTDRGVRLVAELGAQPRTLRPAELIAALDDQSVAAVDEGISEGRVRRTHQWISSGGAKWEPLPLPATRAPHVEARAS